MENNFLKQNEFMELLKHIGNKDVIRYQHLTLSEQDLKLLVEQNTLDEKIQPSHGVLENNKQDKLKANKI